MTRSLLAILFVAALVRAASAGEISGSVANGSRANVPVPDAEVILASRGSDGSLDRRSVTTDDTGRYRFTELAEDSTIIYVVNVRFAGADHPSPFLTLTPSKPAAVHDAVVFDFSSQTAPMRIEAAHWIVAAGDGFIEVTEVYQLVRQGHTDSTDVPVRFALPSGYTHFLPREGIVEGDVDLDESGFRLRSALEAGAHQFIFTYHMPADRYPVRIEHELPYPADAVDVLVHPETATVGSATLSMRGVETLGERQFLYLSQEQVPAGHLVSVVVSSLDGGGRTAPVPGLLAPLAAAVGVATLFAWPVSRALAGRRSKRSERAEARRRLVEEIAVLDLRREAGEVTDADHRAARTALMNRLHILTRAMDDDDGQ